jgi:hypothetical protein
MSSFSLTGSKQMALVSRVSSRGRNKESGVGGLLTRSLGSPLMRPSP